jgi:hypothetical protein
MGRSDDTAYTRRARDPKYISGPRDEPGRRKRHRIASHGLIARLGGGTQKTLRAFDPQIVDDDVPAGGESRLELSSTASSFSTSGTVTSAPSAAPVAPFTRHRRDIVMEKLHLARAAAICAWLRSRPASPPAAIAFSSHRSIFCIMPVAEAARRGHAMDQHIE